MAASEIIAGMATADRKGIIFLITVRRMQDALV
jgi:hypothetical protein